MKDGKLTRRDFFQGMAVLGTAAAVGETLYAKAPGFAKASPYAKASAGRSVGKSVGRPLIVSTWRWGKAANEKAAAVLAGGGSLLDAVEKGINTVELNPEVMTVGYGSIPNEEGVLQLDAAIMDGATHQAGAVAALEKIPTPISVARRVMERTTHTLLGGQGALRFALAEGFEPQQLLTPKALERWEQWRKEPKRKRFWRSSRTATGWPASAQARVGEPVGEEAADTITMVALDAAGNLAAGGSTSGLRWKIPGRIGDVSLIGCGIYVDNPVGAAGATGNGDEMIKFCTSMAIVERMRQGLTPQAACEAVLSWMVETHPANKNIQACVYAVSKRGEFGAASIRAKDFTYAVWQPGGSELRVAKSIL